MGVVNDTVCVVPAAEKERFDGDGEGLDEAVDPKLKDAAAGLGAEIVD